MLVVLLSLVLGWRTVTFQLAGFYCRSSSVMANALCMTSLVTTVGAGGGLTPLGTQGLGYYINRNKPYKQSIWKTCLYCSLFYTIDISSFCFTGFRSALQRQRLAQPAGLCEVTKLSDGRLCFLDSHRSYRMQWPWWKGP